MKQFLLIILFPLLLFSAFCNGVFGVSLQDAKTTILFNGRFTTNTIPDGTYQATIKIFAKGNETDSDYTETVTLNVQERHFNLVLGLKSSIIPISGSIIESNPFDLTSPNIKISVQGQGVETFPLVSVPFSIYSRVTDKALSGKASNVTGNFVTFTTTRNVGLTVGTSRFVVSKSNVGIGTSTPTHALDVSGTVNVTSLYRGGQPFRDTLKWTLNGDEIYYTGGNVGIGVQSLNSKLSVYDGRGTTSANINATEYYMNGRPLSAALDWKRSDVVTENIYFTNGGGNVGIGTVAPNERLDINGGLLIGESAYTVDSVISPGTLYWDGSNFFGYDGTDSKFISGIDGQGVQNRVGYWKNGNKLNSDTHFLYNPITSQLVLGSNPANSTYIHLQPLIVPDQGYMRFRTSTGNVVFLVSPAGTIGIGVTADYKVDIGGTINSDALLVQGDSFQDRFSRSTYWSRNSQNGIYYLDGYVGIGAPTPNGSYLRIGQPINNPSILPAITFRNIRSGADSVYTMGVDTLGGQLFRIDLGDTLGEGTPLFVAYEANMGIGTEAPLHNLVVSGNDGVILSGTLRNFTGLIDDPLLPTLNVGSTLVWYPEKAAFRAGYLDDSGPYLADKWAADQLGLYSIGFGYNSVITQPYSSALGGASHVVDGAYSSVLGGSSNTVTQNFNLAIGVRANAIHFSSFVFRNGSDAGAGFSSQSSNQFVIKSAQGVGINTNETLTSALTVKAYESSHAIARFIGHGPSSNVYTLITPSQNLLLTSDDTLESEARFSVLNGPVAFGGTTTLNASFFAQNVDGVTISFLVEGPSGVTTPNMIIYNSGQVGFGIIPSNDIGLYLPSGSVTAESYVLPSGEEIRGNDAVIVFSSRDSTPNIYFPSGNYALPAGTVVTNEDGEIVDYAPTPGYAGLGNTNPRALFNISKSVLDNALPELLLDNDGVASFSMGMDATRPTTLKIGPKSDSVIAPRFSWSGSNIGIGTSNPQTHFDVAQAYFSHYVKVATSDFQLNGVSANLSASTININQFFYNGGFVSESGTPWTPSSDGRTVYKRSGNVAIGATQASVGEKILRSSLGVYSAPTEDITLRINGTLSANSLILTDYLRITSINVRSVLLPFDDEFYTLFMNSGKIFLSSAANTELLVTASAQAVSDILTRGSNPDGGVLGFWVIQDGLPDTYLSESIFEWDVPDTTLSYTGSFTLHQGNATSNTTFVATNSITTSVNITSPIGFDSSTQLNATQLSDTGSYTSVTLNATITGWPQSNGDWTSVPDSPVEVVGTNIDIDTSRNVTLSLGTNLIGLLVDVSGVTLQENANEGFKYAGLFTGNVGIGSQTPTATLDVYGVVSANGFVISEGLILTTINVSERVISGITSSALYVTEDKLVGIGTQRPQTTLEVAKGEGSFTTLHTGGISASSLTVQTSALNAATNVGIGITAPEAQLHLSRRFSDNSLDTFTFKKVTQLVSANAEDIEVAMVGSSITISANARNTLGHITGQTTPVGTGVSIDLSNLLSAEGGIVQGIVVRNGENSTKNAALFNGGYVGIGTQTPSTSALLTVVGTLLASNFPQAEFLSEQDQASFNSLVVTDGATIGDVTANSVFADHLTLTNLNILDPIVLDGFINNGITVNIRNLLLVRGNVRITEDVRAQTAAIATTARAATASATQLRLASSSFVDEFVMTGPFTSDTLLIHDRLTSTLFSKTNSQFVMYRTLDTEPYRLGFGTATPAFPRVFVATRNSTYSSGDTTTWGSFYLNSDTDHVGVVLTPLNANTESGGSGFVAKRDDTSASSLYFITDPQGSATPLERLVVTATGNVGIGTTTPSERLTVSGSMTVQTTILADTITANTLTPVTQLTVDAAGIDFATTVNAHQHLMMNDTFSLEKINTPNLLADTGSLYTNQSNVLIFRTQLLDDSIITANLSVTFSLESPIIPFYNADHQVSDQGKMYWIAASPIKTFRVGTANTLTNLLQITTVNNSLKTSLEAAHVSLGFPERNLTSIDIGDTIFSGVKIQFIPGQNDTDDRDVVNGVLVDVSDLDANSFNQNTGASLIGYKYAALFTGGSVGIAPGTGFGQATLADNLSTETSLHIKAVSTNASLLVGNTSAYFTVSSQNAVSIGSAPTNENRLHIQGTQNATTQLLSIQKDTSTYLRIDHSGKVALGPTLNAGLSIPGTMAAPAITVTDLYATTIQHPHLAHSGSFFGLGSATARTYLTSEQLISTSNNPVQFSKTDISLDDTISQDITGLGVMIQSLADGNQIDNTAIGMNVNLTDLPNNSGSTVYGLRVHMTDLATSTSHNAAILQGGHVGIGITAPAYDLDVSGNFRINGGLVVNETAFTFEGFDLLTLESLKSDGELTVNSRLEILGNVSANTVEATNLNVRDMINNAIAFNATQFISQTGDLQTVTASAVSSNGLVSANGLIVTTELSDTDYSANPLTMASMNVSSMTVTDSISALSVLTSTSIITGNVGLGTTLPTSKLHVSLSSGTAFNAATPLTYGFAYLSNKSDIDGSGTFLQFTPSDSVTEGVALGSVGHTTSSDIRIFSIRNTSTPSLNVVILSDGNVGIGQSTPTHSLSVVGTGHATSVRTTTFNATEIHGITQIRGTVTFNSTVTVNGLKVTSLLPKQLLTAPTSISGLYPIYASSNGYLTVGDHVIVPTFTAHTDQRVPYFGSTRHFSDTSSLYFNQGQFNIGTTNAAAFFEIITSANDSDTSSKVLELIQVGFPYIENPQNMAYYGLHIKTDASAVLKADDTLNDQADTVRGLYVSMDDLARRATLLNGTVVKGHIVAGAFLGSFGVGTSNVTANFSTEDLVHIRPVTTNTSYATLRVADASNETVLVVRNNGNISIGTTNAVARLQVQSNASTDIFHVEASTSPLLTLNSSGNLGVFTNTPAHTLHLVQPSGRTDRILHLKSDNGDNVVMASNGFIGLQTTQPSTNLHIVSDTANELSFVVSNNNRVLTVTGNLVHFLRPINDPTYGSFEYLATNQSSIFSSIGQIRTGVTTNAFAFSTETSSTQNVGFGSIYQNQISKLDLADGFNTSTSNFYFQQNGTPVMTFHSKNIGIGTTLPQALLHIDNTNLQVNPFAIRKSNAPVFYVTSAGNIGIGTESPAYSLDIAGNVTVNGNLSITNLNVTTLNPVKTIQVNGKIESDFTFDNNTYTLYKVDTHHTKDLSASAVYNGLSVDIDSSASVVGDIIGLNVDFTDINFFHENQTSSGNGIAAVFVGGAVNVIPTGSVPVSTGNRLFVYMKDRTNTLQNVHFDHASGVSMNIFTETIGGTQYYDFSRPDTASNKVYISTDLLRSTDREGNAVTIAPVLVNEVMALTTEALLVGTANGQSGLRVGALKELPIGQRTPDDTNDSGLTVPGMGSKLWFSGAPFAYLSGINGFDSDNFHHFWVARSNRRLNNSALNLAMFTPDETQIPVPLTRIVIGPGLNANTTNTAESVFISTIADAQLSSTPESGPLYNHVTYSTIKTGVGIGVAQPFAPLHVKADKSGSDSVSTNYVAVFENANVSANADGLAIHIPNAGASNSFITFMGATSPSFDDILLEELSTPTLYGSIIGLENSSVQYVSPGADYSEYIEKVSADEVIEKGDVVGIVNGKVTRTTTGADQVMAISSSPIIVGNFNDLADKSALVAFLGQVPIKVMGPVTAGDYLVPTGFNDGMAKAIKPYEMTPNQLHQIIGRAWETSASSNVKLVKTVIGFQFQQHAISERLDRLAELRKQVALLTEENNSISSLYEARLNTLQEKLSKAKSLIK